jgi:hypothetical protein
MIERLCESCGTMEFYEPNDPDWIGDVCPECATTIRVDEKLAAAIRHANRVAGMSGLDDDDPGYDAELDSNDAEHDALLALLELIDKAWPGGAIKGI